VKLAAGENWRQIIDTIRTDYMEGVMLLANIIPYALQHQVGFQDGLSLRQPCVF
jgi:hypothetical protein